MQTGRSRGLRDVLVPLQVSTKSFPRNAGELLYPMSYRHTVLARSRIPRILLPWGKNPAGQRSKDKVQISGGNQQIQFDLLRSPRS